MPKTNDAPAAQSRYVEIRRTSNWVVLSPCESTSGVEVRGHLTPTVFQTDKGVVSALGSAASERAATLQRNSPSIKDRF
jgi:hypothetical protein